MSDLVLSPRKRPKRFNFLKFLLILLMLLFIGAGLAGGGYLYWKYKVPNQQHVGMNFGGVENPIFYQGKLYQSGAIGSKDSLELPLDFIQKYIDPHIFYEAGTQSVIITTGDKVVRLRNEQLTATVNGKPVQLHFSVQVKGNKVYVPIAPLEDYYKINIRQNAATGAVFLERDGDAVMQGNTLMDSAHPSRKIEMRNNPGIKNPIIADVASKTNVMIWGDTPRWYYVQLDNGYEGYIKKDEIRLGPVRDYHYQTKAMPYLAWRPIGNKIDLTWEQVFNKNPDTGKIGKMSGLNVVSPTWFELAKDKHGNLYIRNHADLSYVKWAHDRDYQVWALFSNGFLPAQTHEALSTFDNRMKWIHQLLDFAALYHLQGINIDFENVNPTDKELLTEFVREMVPLMHEQNLVVSIDVTVRGGSANWSQFFDRKALGQAVDYMMVMAYDEHWASDPEAGSVASLPWVENSVKAIMKQDQVPADKLMLGVPMYTRIWKETTKDGKTSISSKAVGMDKVEALIKEKKLNPQPDSVTGQDFVQYQESGATYKIWLEDAHSMKERVDLVKKYGLAGLASWSRAFGTANIWNTISDELQKRP